MITPLYKGTILLNFEEGRHRFTVNGKTIISVTGATGVIDKSRPLIIWATRLGRDFLLENLKVMIKDDKGEKIAALIHESITQHFKVKKKAADVGTQIHDWAEGYIKAKTKKDIPAIPEDPQVYNGVTAFLKWVDEYDVKFISSEKQIYSKKYNYAGIMDAEAIIKRKLSVVDFKSSKAIYPEMRFQVAAYQGASEEEKGEEYSGNKWLVRFGKDDGEFEAKDYAQHDQDFEGFLNALGLKRRLKEIEIPYVRK